MGSANALTVMSNSVVLITGAAGRLGAALCEAYARSCNVVAAFHTNEPTAVSQLRRPISSPADQTRGPIYSVQADLAERSDIRRLVEVALARFGQIDVVINAAADTRFHGRLTELIFQGDECARQLMINAFAPALLVSAVFQNCWKDDVPANRSRNRNVVNVSSQSAIYAAETKGQGFYGASKAALNLLTLHQALELEPYGVRANVICPGTFTDPSSTQRVVAAIESLSKGSQTGQIVTRYQ